MTRFYLYLPFFVLMQIVAKLCTPIAVIWFSTPDRTQLKAPFQWLMTLDADLGGDKYWPSHITGDRYSTWNRIKWMWRNGGHTLSYGLFGCVANDARYPLSRRYLPVSLGKYRFLEVSTGWNHPGAQRGRAKYMLSIRLKEKAA